MEEVTRRYDRPFERRSLGYGYIVLKDKKWIQLKPLMNLKKRY